MQPVSFREATIDELPAIIDLLADDGLGRGRESPGLPLHPNYFRAFETIRSDPNQLLAVADRGLRVYSPQQSEGERMHASGGSAQNRAHVGTSGWTYKHWLGRFYPTEARGESRLKQYARIFRSVEINGTFYKMPTDAAIKAWLAETPEDFTFTIKTSRFITHRKRLREPEVHIPIFYGRVAPLAPKTAAHLVQLPPNFRADLPRLRAFSELLPPGRYAFEFRHESWWSDEVYSFLADRGYAFTLFHLAGRDTPEVVTADFVYARLHGPGAAYQGSYDDATLDAWAARTHGWLAENRDVFIFFDNDEKAYAAEDARRLGERLGLLRCPGEVEP